MAKNLEHCMSPVTIGLKLDPTYPTRNDTAGSVHIGTYRTDTGIRTMESGDLVRFGSVVGVVMVDHQDKLADPDGKPVINFGLNVWRFKGVIKSVAAAIEPGAELWYYSPAEALLDNATSKAAANESRLFAGKPTASEHTILVADEGRMYRLGTILDGISATLGLAAAVPDELRCLIGGVATLHSEAVA